MEKIHQVEAALYLTLVSQQKAVYLYFIKDNHNTEKERVTLSFNPRLALQRRL